MQLVIIIVNVSAYLLDFISHGIRKVTLYIPNVAIAGELQSPRKRDFRFATTSTEGEAVIICCEPLATRVADPVEDGNLEFSGFPARVNNLAKSAHSLEFTIGDIQKIVHGLLSR